MGWIYDSHIHLSDIEYEQDMTFLIQSMNHLKIRACCVSVDYSSSLRTLHISKKTDLIFPFIGIHPEKADDDIDSMMKLIEENHNLIAGIGEIGLDPTYAASQDDLKKQRSVFESLLSISEKYHKPVSIHSRKSLDDILELFPSFDVKNALLHWFDGSKKQLQKAMDLGFYVSYGPLLIYANDKQSLLKDTTPDKFLVETDGPVRFSRCFGHKVAQVSFIPSVIFCASKILKRSYEETENLLQDNSERYLCI